MLKLTKTDLLTPANAITLIGLVLTVAGMLRFNTYLGLALVFAGRTLDLLDGPVARRTRTSRIGAIFDATTDKIVSFGLLIAAYLFDLAPLWFIVPVFLYHLSIVAYSVMTEHRGASVETIQPGKYAIFLQTGALVLFVWASLSDTLDTAAFIAAIVLAVGSIGFALSNLRSYVQKYRAAKPQTHK